MAKARQGDAEAKVAVMTRVDERAVQGEATQQPASTMRGREARRLRIERMIQDDDVITRRWKADGVNRGITDAKARLVSLERSLAETTDNTKRWRSTHDNVVARENKIM